MPLAAMPILDEYGMPVGRPGLDAQHQAALDALRQSSNAAISMPLALAAPDPKLPGVAGYIPFMGAGEAALGTIGALGSANQRLTNAALDAIGIPSSKYGMNIPTPELLTKAADRFAENRETIKTGIEKYTGGALTAPNMNTTAGNVADIIGSSVGSGVGFAPGWVANAAPTGLKTITSMLLPSVEHAATTVPLMTAAGVTQGIADLALHPAPDAQPAPGGSSSVVTQPPPPAPPSQTPPQPSADGNATFFAGAKVAPPTAPQAPDTGPTSFFNAALGNTPPADGNASFFGNMSPPGVTFTQQGNTGVPLWAAALPIITTVALIAAGGRTHRMGAEISEAARDARFRDPAYAAKVAEYNADVIARGPNSGSMIPPSGAPVPAPLPEGSALRRGITYAADKVTNEAAQVQNEIHMTSADPEAAERLSAMAGNQYDSRLQQDRTALFLETGHDSRTGINVPPPIQLLKDNAALPQPKADLFTEGKKSLDEIQTRTNNERVWRKANPGADPSLEDIAHNLIGKGTDELRAKAAEMMADPQLAEMAQRYKQITDGMIDMGLHPNYGFFDTKEAGNLKSQRSDYVPEMDVNGKSMHPFGPRDTSAFTGQAQIMTNPVKDLMAHLEQMYPQFERNLFNRQLYDHLRTVQETVPGSPHFLTDVKAPAGLHDSYYPTDGLPKVGGQARDPIVSIRTPDGVKYIRNDDPISYHAMVNHSLGSAKVALGAASTARRLYQQFTTGMGSTLTGRLTPVNTAAATAVLAPLNAPRNMRAGLLDYGLQRLSRGGRANRPLQTIARTADMALNLPATAGSYALGVGDRRIKNFADVFAPGAKNIANRGLRAIAGDHVVDAIQSAANKHWEHSTTRWIEEESGVAGAGSPIKLDAPGVVTGTTAGPGSSAVGIRSIAAGLAPKAYFAGDWMHAKPFILNVRSALGEALNHISDAGLEYEARLNRSNPNISPEALTYNVRGLYGNPGRHGSSTNLARATSVMPWANIAIQELGSTGAALGRRPVATALTGAMGMGSLAALQLLTAMRSKEHMDFLQNQISTSQREANIILSLNSDPNKPTMIRLPRSLRVANAFMLDVMSKAINMVAARHDPVTFNGVWEGLKDFLGSHITTSDAMAMRHGLVDMGDFVNAPPQYGHLDYNQWYEHGFDNLSSALHGSWSGATDRQAPGQAPETVMDTKNIQVIRNILTNVIGAAAATAFNTPADILRYHHQGHTWLDSLGTAGHDWLQTARESNPTGNNLLYETPIRLSKVPPIAESLEPTLFALKNLPAMPGPVTNVVQKGVNQLPVPPTGEVAVSDDVRIRSMLQVAHAYSTRIDQSMVPVNAIKQQMGAVDKMGMDPVKKREWMNANTRLMADRYKLVDAYTNDMYYTLSKLAGKPINNLNAIQWNKDMSQFR